MNKLKQNRFFALRNQPGFILVALLVLTLALTACTSTDERSTQVSATVRPVTVVEGANNNTNPLQPGQGGQPTDPTRSAAQANGPTATPGRPTQTLGAGQTTAAAGTTAAGGGAATTAAGGGGAGNAGSGDATAGLAVFQANCTGCHKNDGKAAGIGPKLQGYSELKGKDAAFVKGVVKNGYNKMQAVEGVDGADLDNVAAYVISLQK